MADKTQAADVAPGQASSRQAAPAGPRANRRKVRDGVVVSNKMDNTAVVLVVENVRHPRYAKTMHRNKKLYADNAGNDAKVGDRVRLVETRPISKLKRWRVAAVLERAR